MERKGQLFLMIGVTLSLISIILDKDFVPDYEWIYFIQGVIIGLAVVFVIWGIILVFRAKMKKK